MSFTLNLPKGEPVDIYIVCRAKHLYYIIVTADSIETGILGDYSFSDFALCCRRNSFARENVEVYIVEDCALVEGAACYAVELSPKISEVVNEISNS